MRSRRPGPGIRIRVACAAAVIAVAAVAAAAPGVAGAVGADAKPLNAHQRSVLYGIAGDTWRFYAADVDPGTHLPLDNLGPGSVRGTYTSAANIGVYLWAVVAAHDLGLIDRHRALSLIRSTLTEVGTLKRLDGMLYQLYDTNNGDVLKNPGGPDCSETVPSQDNCWFVSAVDNGWYASGLVEVREALPELRGLADALLRPMNFSIFYDGRAQTACNTNPSLPDNPATGQMYGGYYVDQGPAGYHNSALYSDPRIAIYMGMGLHQMPGDVWWRTWRTLPPKQCSTDPDFSSQGPVAGRRLLADLHGPAIGQAVQRLGGALHLPRDFADLRADLCRGHGRGPDGQPGRARDEVGQPQLRPQRPPLGRGPGQVRDAGSALSGVGHVAIQYRGRHRGLRRLRRRGSRISAGERLAQCTTPCATEDVVSPQASTIALPVLAQQAYANLQALRSLYPGVYRTDGGFFDAVNPTTGAVGHRRLVLDQSMIMAALDDALHHDALQRYFARDPISWAARLYLSYERMSLG